MARRLMIGLAMMITMAAWSPAAAQRLSGAEAALGPGAEAALGPGAEAAPERGLEAARQSAIGGSTPDFLFGRPDGWVGVRTGRFFPRAGSDWYAFVTDQLTVDRQDFRAADISADIGIALSRKVDVVAGVGVTTRAVGSEYRRFVDNNRLPIMQDTRLQTVGLTGSARLALWDRGREVGQLAFVPRRVVPFVGAGGGALWYRLEQTGDFVDFVDLSVFPSTFESRGWAPTAHVLTGVDVRVARRILLTVDGRYQWAAATLTSTWVDFDPIDLSGFRLTGGINVVF
jgi:hypothetical protein